MTLFKPLDIQTNKSLQLLNTFGIDVSTKFFTEIDNLDALRKVLSETTHSPDDILVLGGGSNILFTKDFDGLVLKNNIQGIQVLSENKDEITLRVGAGENWHDFVMYCVENNYGGIENLSLIPGNVGASPMQNIGAYGVEIKDVVVDVEYVELSTGEEKKLEASDCEFGYRTSIFKTALKGKVFISYVTFRLQKHPILNTSYGAIEQELLRLGLEASVQSISMAVVNIRKSKLPDPAEIGNAGSFFKNPVVDSELSKSLRDQYPDMPIYDAGSGKSKIAAGWLIEKAGWKGKRENGFGVHAKQALVLVNYGGSKGSQINELSNRIQHDIQSKFGISLEKEVNIL